ncbi:MAG TPA: dipeptidase [Thermoanaerobaculia bacterium]|nr:dipeptidase [Thermoanaerobaculia bacterium]
MSTSEPEKPAARRKTDVHRNAIVVDGHCDTPYRLRRVGLQIEDSDPDAQLDLETLKASGITATFFASYVPPFYASRGAAQFAHDLIDIIVATAARHPDTLMLGTRSAHIREAKAKGRIALMIGIEGGHAIEDSLDTLRTFYARGVRYLTLTHVNTNNWADSSGDTHRHGGLTSFGREVVRTMNELGMIVDIAHVSDNAFYHALETSAVPIIASHSSCRALTNHARNMTDQMLKDLAASNGLCMINFFSAFINQGVATVMMKAQKRPGHRDLPGADEELPDDRIDWALYLDWFRALGCPEATIDDAVDHIAHAASVAGIDHVGIGSDFDGVPSLPSGLKDASFLPLLTDRLADRGFSDDEIEKILGKNFLRVFEAVESGRRESATSNPPA